MKTTIIITAILTGLLLFSTIVCGLWIRNSGELVEESSIIFHMVIGLATALVTAGTVILALVSVYRLPG